jgi:HEAT repeat protein/cyclophilin family peptidyl-prolyl cis-trans isomerase
MTHPRGAARHPAAGAQAHQQSVESLRVMRRHLRVAVSIVIGLAVAAPGAQTGRRPLAPADIDAIVQLVSLEDTRRYDEAVLGKILKSAHPEVRRRAIVSIARINNPAGREMLTDLRRDSDPEIVATVAFAAGQLKDPAAVAWLGQVLAAPGTAEPVAFEAARALGKIRTPDARAALAQFLGGVAYTSAPEAVVGEALLAVGRFAPGDDIMPIARWVTAADVEVRWRTAWALFRLQDPAALPHLLRLADDQAAAVRFWAVRGLSRAVIAKAGQDPTPFAARLRNAARDTDRQVRTEAVRALVQYDDEASFAAVLGALDSTDTWLSVSAAEGMDRFKSRADVVVPRLIAAAAPTRPAALRMTLLTPLAALAPEAAADLALALVREKSTVARSVAAQALQKLGPAGKAKLDQLAQDPATKDLATPPAAAPRPPPAKRAEGDYRRIVQRWVVADYNGTEKPRAVLTTPRGEIEIELYPGDAPLGVEQFVSLVEGGSILGTEFGRVVPNFVAQQQPIRGAATLRDEVSRRGLTRANVSWASAGLDTGRPGYTFGVTPQPHNEGDFTALGRVVRGIEVVERLERGDAVTAARMIK